MTTSTAIAAGTLVIVETTIAIAALLVRQWRLAPRARVVASVTLAVAAVSILFSYPTAVVDRREWSGVLVAIGVAIALVDRDSRGSTSRRQRPRA